MLSPLPPAIGQERFPSKVVGRNDEGTVRLRIADVNNLQAPTAPGLTDRQAGTVSPGTILSGIGQDLLHLYLVDVMIPDVRLT